MRIFFPGMFTKVLYKRRLKKADKQATDKEKKQQQAMKQRNIMHEEALQEAERVTYEAGGF